MGCCGDDDDDLPPQPPPGWRTYRGGMVGPPYGGRNGGGLMVGPPYGGSFDGGMMDGPQYGGTFDGRTMYGPPYGGRIGSRMPTGRPRVGMPPGMAAGVRSRRPESTLGSSTAFESPPNLKSNAGGGSQRGGDIGSGSRRPESRQGGSRRGESRHGEGSHLGSGSRRPESRSGGSRRGESRHGEGSHLSGGYGASTRAGPDPVGPRTFNNRGGPPPAAGCSKLYGSLGGSQATVRGSRPGSRGASPARGNPPQGSQAHTTAAGKVRGPMPSVMQMGGRPQPRRSSRSGL